MLRGQLSPADLALLCTIGLFAVAGLAVVISDPTVLRPLDHLYSVAISDKLSSSSGQERMYWNLKSIQSFFDTSGIGIGLGSSRASSWVIAVFSQLGLFGSALMAALVFYLAIGMRGVPGPSDTEDAATIAGVRASGLASLVSAAISGGNADPGIYVMIALATVLVARSSLRKRARNLGTDPDDTPVPAAAAFN